MQCVIYDTNQSDVRLIGVEYIISARLFGSWPTRKSDIDSVISTKLNRAN
jgi:Protein of unknown function (DUF1264)